MSTNTVIDLRQLQLVVNRLLDHVIKTKGVERVELKQNLYWNVSSEEIYTADNDPKHLDIGSLKDEWDFVKTLTDTSAEPVTLQLAQVAPLLRYIADTVPEA